MHNISIKLGDIVTPTEKAVVEFEHLSSVWNLPYPSLGEECKVLGVRLHPVHREFYLLRLEGYPQELCHHCFRKMVKLFNWSEEEIRESLNEPVIV